MCEFCQFLANEVYIFSHPVLKKGTSFTDFWLCNRKCTQPLAKKEKKKNIYIYIKKNQSFKKNILELVMKKKSCLFFTT